MKNRKMSPVLLYTAEGETLKKELEKDKNAPVFDTYPRPLMKRNSFVSLNGAWDFANSINEALPESYSEKILVPFAPQSLLSGITRDIPDKSYLFYRKKFSLRDENSNRDRVLLHFGAVDRECTVFVNGNAVGSHKGGYFPFYFDITESLKEVNTVEVRAYDAIDRLYPYGKQSLSRGGMWYTPVSGIWQTVWLECVPEKYITSVDCETKGNVVTVKVTSNQGDAFGTVSVETPDGTLTAELSDGKAEITVENPLMWSPENPNLYDLSVTVGEDTVESYFAFRTLEIKNEGGIPRLCLNGKPYFFHGLLDQGYYSDGLFLPAKPEGFARDILETKALGFNTLRKHIKIEPQIFYSMCDRLGMIVFQDMVNNGSYSFLRDTALPTAGIKILNDKKLNRDPETRKIFRESMKKTVKILKNHPSVCMWTIFNEGWGQFEGDKMYEELRSLDKSRFIDTASGWFTCKNNDLLSLHVYFKKFRMPKKTRKPVFLSEFGGYSYKKEGHVFNTENTYGYRFFKEREKFENALEKLYLEEIVTAVKKGLCASVYTQLSDVEDETNGILTYDRKFCKVDAEKMINIAEMLTKEISSEN